MLVQALPTCPRCGEGGMTSDWFDEDETCFVCGHVRYSTEPPSERHSPIFNTMRMRRNSGVALIDGTIAQGTRRRRL